MTSTDSLLVCPAADITFARVQELLDQGLVESLTLEYKRRYTERVVDSVAAMANTYGGLVLVGVEDNRHVVGVPESAVQQIVNGCYAKLEPPWQPEIIPVLIPNTAGSYIMVIRVDSASAPRPVLIDGRAPVRLPTRIAHADRDRLAQLFQDGPTPSRGALGWVPQPQIPRDGTGNPEVDLIIRAGFQVPVGESAKWRPFSGPGVKTLIDALEKSPLQALLLTWCGEIGVPGVNPFRRLGFNRARQARLVWQAVVSGSRPSPLESICEVRLPDAQGTGTVSLVCTIDIVVSIRTLLASGPEGFPPPTSWRLTMRSLYLSLDSMLATLTDQSVKAALADLAAVESIALPQPATTWVLTGPTVTDLLDLTGLRPIPDAGPSGGATLMADPSLDLSDAPGRLIQVDNWLVQFALDAGLVGMEELLARYHEA